MNKPIIITLTAAALLVLAGCAKEPGLADSGDITIEASVGAMTKVSYDGDKTAFTAGDKISVYAWLGSADAVPDKRVVDGVVNKLESSGSWKPEKQMLWKGVDEKHYFLGVFPARSIASFTADEFVLDPDDYTASDLLIATNLEGVSSKGGAVKLNFDHAMAKLVVNLKFRNQWDATPDVSSVTVSAKTAATVNYLTTAVTATGDASVVGLAAAASAPTGYELSYRCLAIPQEGVRKVTITIDNKNYNFISDSDIPLRSGEITTLCLNVGLDNIGLGSLTVTDWTAGTVFPDGDAEVPEDVLEDIWTYKHLREVYLSRFDINQDGILSQKEADAVTVMDISSAGLTQSLLGLWHFPNLTYLDCSDNDLGPVLRVNMNPKLEYLDCRHNNDIDHIWIAPGQVIKEMYLPKPDNPPISLKVNGQYAIVQEISKSFSFEASLNPEMTAESITWVSNLPGFDNVVHSLQGLTDNLSFDKAADIGDLESGKLYKMYVETPDGSRSNVVRFGVFGKDPIIYFEKPFREIGIQIEERMLFSVFFYPGEGESGTPSIKTIGEGCNRSFNSGVKIQEDEAIHWSKPGQKRVIVYFEKNGKKTSDTLSVNVETHIIEFEEHVGLE